MARRSLSTQGRILAAGVSIAVGSALVGFMAAGDHSADASPTNTSSVSATGDSGSAGATPYDNRDFPTGNSGFSPQPQTRTGGS